TLVFLGKKKQGENFEKMMEEEYKANQKEKTEGDQSKLVRDPRKRPRLEELDPNLRVMDYIYTREKKSLNRNSILKPMSNPSSFESLLVLCKKIFTRTNGEQRTNEMMSFLDELCTADDLRGNKAIIIVPSTY